MPAAPLGLCQFRTEQQHGPADFVVGRDAYDLRHFVKSVVQRLPLDAELFACSGLVVQIVEACAQRIDQYGIVQQLVAHSLCNHHMYGVIGAFHFRHAFQQTGIDTRQYTESLPAIGLMPPQHIAQRPEASIRAMVSSAARPRTVYMYPLPAASSRAFTQ